MNDEKIIVPVWNLLLGIVPTAIVQDDIKNEKKEF